MPRVNDDSDGDGGGNGDDGNVSCNSPGPYIPRDVGSHPTHLLASCQLMPDSFLKDAYLL